jgi:hypothetical protein
MATPPRAIVGRIQLRYSAMTVAGKVISLASEGAGLALDLNELVPKRKPPAIPSDWREIDDIGVNRPGSKRPFLLRGKDAGAPQRSNINARYAFDDFSWSTAGSSHRLSKSSESPVRRYSAIFGTAECSGVAFRVITGCSALLNSACVLTALTVSRLPGLSCAGYRAERSTIG